MSGPEQNRQRRASLVARGDCPTDRMVCIIGNRDGEGRAETDPLFGALDTNAVILFAHYLTSVSEWRWSIRRSKAQNQTRMSGTHTARA
jgi:hypothetical protein